MSPAPLSTPPRRWCPVCRAHTMEDHGRAGLVRAQVGSLWLCDRCQHKVVLGPLWTGIFALPLALIGVPSLILGVLDLAGIRPIVHAANAVRQESPFEYLALGGVSVAFLVLALWAWRQHRRHPPGRD